MFPRILDALASVVELQKLMQSCCIQCFKCCGICVIARFDNLGIAVALIWAAIPTFQSSNHIFEFIYELCDHLTYTQDRQPTPVHRH